MTRVTTIMTKLTKKVNNDNIGKNDKDESRVPRAFNIKSKKAPTPTRPSMTKHNIKNKKDQTKNTRRTTSNKKKKSINTTTNHKHNP